MATSAQVARFARVGGTADWRARIAGSLLLATPAAIDEFVAHDDTDIR